MKRNSPRIHHLLALSTAHLCAETREYLSNLPAGNWPILGGDTEYGYFVHCPEIQDLPADLWACIAFAKNQGAEYILFDKDEDLLPDLIDFTLQPDERAIGMIDARIESGAHADTVVLPAGVRIVFHKARDSHVMCAQTQMFLDAWRKLVGRDDAGVLSPAAIEALERRRNSRPTAAMHHDNGDI